MEQQLMRTTMNNSGLSNPQAMPSVMSEKMNEEVPGELNSIYRELSLCLDSIQDMLYFLDDTNGKVCLTVLEDDVCDLLDECGEYLISNQEPAIDMVMSLECRTSTVIEELKGVLSP